MLKTHAVIVSAIVGSGSVLSTPVVAQNAPSSPDATQDMEEIVVTAQKRIENIVDVPISISVINEEQLRLQQVNSISDLSRTNPQMVGGGSGEGSPGGGVIIRGIGTRSFSRSASGSVGVVIDGVPTGNVNITNIFDVARIEILAGPQGTLFGDSVSAGIVNIVTNTPRLTEYSGSLNMDYVPRLDRYSQETVRGVVNIPVGATAAVRASAYYNEDNGPVHNLYNGQWGGNELYGGRMRFLWEPMDALRINLIGDYNKSKTKENFFVAADTNGNVGFANHLAACGITASLSNFDRCGSQVTNADNTNWGVSGQLDYDIGGFTLTSITSYRNFDSLIFADIDGLPFVTSVTPGNQTLGFGDTDVVSGPEKHPQTLVSQELRLANAAGSKFEYVVGAYFQKYHSLHQQAATVTLGPQVAFLNRIEAYQQTLTKKTDYALFGESTIRLSDSTRAILGLRLNRSTIDDTYSNSDVLVPRSLPFTISNPYSNNVNDSVENISFKFGVIQEVTSNVNGYATITRGYKNPQAFDTERPVEDSNGNVINVYLVKPELPLYYEVGTKSELFNHRLVLTADVYYAQIKNFQDDYCPTPTQANPTPVCVASNVDGITSRGVDVLVTGNLMKDLSVNGGVSYADAKYPEPFYRRGANGLVNIGGEQLGYAPTWRAVLSANYTPYLSADLRGLFGVDVDWQTENGLNIDNIPHGVNPARAMIGARVGVSKGDKYSLTLYGRNLTNERNPGGTAGVVYTTSASTIYSSNSVRAIGLSFDVKF